MYDLFFSDGALWFTVPAILGTVFFVLRLALLLVGAGHDGGFDLHGDAGDVHADSGHDFQVLSVQSIACFLMGFGWGALGALRGLGWQVPGSVLFGCAVGAGFVYILAILLRGMSELQSSGNIEIESAVGLEGDIYVSVPGESRGRGQVRLNIDERQRIYNAISSDEPLPTGTRVRVIRANHDNTLTVARA